MGSKWFFLGWFLPAFQRTLRNAAYFRKFSYISWLLNIPWIIIVKLFGNKLPLDILWRNYLISDLKIKSSTCDLAIQWSNWLVTWLEIRDADLRLDLNWKKPTRTQLWWCVLVAQTDLSDSTQHQSSQMVKNYAWYRKCIIKLLTNRKPPKSLHYSVGNIAGEWSWSQAKWRITDRKTLSSSKTYLWSAGETENQRSASSRASSYTFSRD